MCCNGLFLKYHILVAVCLQVPEDPDGVCPDEFLEGLWWWRRWGFVQEGAYFGVSLASGGLPLSLLGERIGDPLPEKR